MADYSEGATVLSVNWITDSLEARILLPCKYYVVRGIPPAPAPWSTFPLPDKANVDPISSLKSVFGKVFRSAKRPADEETPQESRKRQISRMVSNMQVALSRLKEIEKDVGTGLMEGKIGARQSLHEPTGEEWIEMSEVTSSPSSQCSSPSHLKQSEITEDSGELGRASRIHDGIYFSTTGSASEAEPIEMELEPSIVDEYDIDGSVAESSSEPETPFSQVNYVSDWCDEDSDDEIDTDGIFKYRSSKKGVQTFDDDENDWKLEDYLMRTLDTDCFGGVEDEGDTGVMLAKLVGPEDHPEGVKLRDRPEAFSDREECKKAANVVTSDELDQQIRSLKWDLAGNQMYETESPFPPRTFKDIANGPSRVKMPVQLFSLSPGAQSSHSPSASSDPYPDALTSGSASKCSSVSPTLSLLKEESGPYSVGQALQNHFKSPSADILTNAVTPVRSSLSPVREEESIPHCVDRALQTVFKNPSMDVQSDRGSDSNPGPKQSQQILQTFVKTAQVNIPTYLDSSAGSTVDIKNSPRSTDNGTESTIASPCHCARSAARPPTAPPNFSTKDDPPLPFSVLLEEFKDVRDLKSSNRTEAPRPPGLPKFTYPPPQFASQTRASSVPPQFSPGSARRFTSCHLSARGASPALSSTSDRDTTPPSQTTVPIGAPSESSHALNAMSPLDLGSPLIGSPATTSPTYPIVLSSENVTPRSLARQVRLDAERRERLSGPNFDVAAHDLALPISPRPTAKPRRRRLPQPNRLFGDNTGQSFAEKKNKVGEVDVKIATDTKLLLTRRGDPVF